MYYTSIRFLCCIVDSYQPGVVCVWQCHTCEWVSDLWSLVHAPVTVRQGMPHNEHRRNAATLPPLVSPCMQSSHYTYWEWGEARGWKTGSCSRPSTNVFCWNHFVRQRTVLLDPLKVWDSFWKFLFLGSGVHYRIQEFWVLLAFLIPWALNLHIILLWFIIIKLVMNFKLLKKCSFYILGNALRLEAVWCILIIVLLKSISCNGYHLFVLS